MKNLTWQNPEQLFVAQELINKVKSKCCGIKVTNEYIEEIFFALYNIHIELIDKPVSLLGYCCPCCNYKVYRKMEIFDICPVCMWENTNTGEDQYSAPNRSTLKEYRQAFLNNQKLEPNNLKYIQYELGSI